MDNNETLDLIEQGSFDNLSKEQLNKLTKALSKIDKDVLVEYVKQLPNFKDFAENTIKVLKDSSSEIMTNNDLSRSEAVEVLKGRIDFLSELAKSKDTFDEDSRKEFVNLSIDLAKEVVQIHKDNQKFLLKIFGVLAGAAGGAAVILTSIYKILESRNDDEESYEDIYTEVDEN